LRRGRHALARGPGAGAEAARSDRRPAAHLASHAVLRAFGHDEFILCAGYGAELIKDFLEETANPKVSLVDTGEDASIGERLRAVSGLLDGDEMFLANYSDGLTDLPLRCPSCAQHSSRSRPPSGALRMARAQP
jgi:hypothetical protein